MRNLSVEIEAQAALGEGPRWHGGERRLYWVDIARNRLHRYDPATGTGAYRSFAEPVGCFAFVAGGGWLLAMKSGCALLRDWTGEPEPFGPQIFADRPDLRFNDGRTDALGRFWIGSVNMAKSATDAALYRLDGDGTLTLIENEMTTCNGAAFSADGRRFCHADTPSHDLRAYDCDPQSGLLSARRLFHRFPMGKGRPDGGSFDIIGDYWTALYEGGRVVRLSRQGEIVEEVPLPVTRPTMIAFGGDDLRTAFVTSARGGLSDAQIADQPLAGALFSFQVDVPGVAEAEFVLR